jgi:hypothetical protein
MATVLAANAHDLAGLLEHPPASEDELHAMRERDRRGVRLHRQLSARIATSYMVPFQREDLHALTERLTDVIDDLRHGAELLVVLHPDVIPDQLVAHSRVVADAADQARMLVSQLPAGAAGPTLADIDHLERQGDTIFRQALGWLLSGAHDDLDVIRWKDILEILEHALKGIEKVGDIVEEMLIRHS